MTTLSGWRTLQTPTADISHLLVKTSFTYSGYTVYLSDFGRIWQEEVSKNEISQKARKWGSSIDPDENDEQYQILLAKIESALNKEPGTVLNLSVGQSDGLVLQLSAPLPSPLPRFTWIIYLSPSAATTIATQLVSPLIQQVDLLNRNISSLIAELHAKDKVISRITDRLEASGHDLTAVFPGISGVKFKGKKTHAQQLASHVAGLTEFDEKAWRAGNAEQPIELEVTRKGLDRVLRSLPTAADARDGRVHGDDNWWRTIDEKGIDLNQLSDVQDPVKDSKPKTRRIAIRDAVDQNSMDVDQDGGDFQKQQTPPQSRQHVTLDSSLVSFGGQDRESDKDDLDAPSQPTQRSQLSQRISQQPPQDHGGDENSTDPGTDLDEPPASQLRQKAEFPSPIRQSPPHQAASPKKKLGTVGGRARKPSLQPQEKPAKPSASPPTEPRSAPQTKPKSKLGTIGGKRKPAAASTPDTSKTHEDTPPPTTEPTTAKFASSPNKPRSKLGTIGGKKNLNTNSNIEPKTERASREPKQQQQPAERETSQERADRKREELKRELEAKAKAPAKKKRKF